MSNTDNKCSFSTACADGSTGEHRDELFEHSWEEFVIRHDAVTGKFSWFTECCKRIVNGFVNGKNLSPTADR